MTYVAVRAQKSGFSYNFISVYNTIIAMYCNQIDAKAGAGGHFNQPQRLQEVRQIESCFSVVRKIRLSINKHIVLSPARTGR
jgi:hypothetical protein